MTRPHVNASEAKIACYCLVLRKSVSNNINFRCGRNMLTRGIYLPCLALPCLLREQAREDYLFRQRWLNFPLCRPLN